MPPLDTPFGQFQYPTSPEHVDLALKQRALAPQLSALACKQATVIRDVALWPRRNGDRVPSDTSVT